VDKISILVLGVGFFGKNWLRELAACAECEVAGVVAKHPELLASVGDEFAIPVARRFATIADGLDVSKADAVVVGVHADGELTPSARAIDAASAGAVKAAVKSGDMTGKRGTQLLLRGLPGVAAPRVLLVGLGGKDDFSEKAFGDAVRTSVKAFGGAARHVAVAACDWHVKGRKSEWQARTLAIATRETAFRSDELKSKREPDGNGVDSVTLLLGERKPEEIQA